MEKKKGYSQAQNKATQKYVKAAYDTITVRVRKGEREQLTNFAKNHGYSSLNNFIVSAITDSIKRHMTEDNAES